jgi:hypothetical protein
VTERRDDFRARPAADHSPTRVDLDRPPALGSELEAPPEALRASPLASSEAQPSLRASPRRLIEAPASPQQGRARMHKGSRMPSDSDHQAPMHKSFHKPSRGSVTMHGGSHEPHGQHHSVALFFGAHAAPTALKQRRAARACGRRPPRRRLARGSRIAARRGSSRRRGCQCVSSRLCLLPHCDVAER